MSHPHERARELAAAALDFELSAAERRELIDHVAGCAACRRFQSSIRNDASALQALSSLPAPIRVRSAAAAAATHDGTGAAFLDRLGTGRADRRFGPAASAVRLAILAALVAALLVGLALSSLLVGQRHLAVVPPPALPRPTIVPPDGLSSAPTVRSIEASVQTCPVVLGLTAGNGALWLACQGEVWRVDPATAQVTARVAGPGLVATGAEGVWAVGGNDIYQLDPSSARIVARIPYAGGGTAIAVGAGSVWVVDTHLGNVARIDPKQRRLVATIKVGTTPVAVAVAYGSAWVVDRPATGPCGSAQCNSTIARIDPVRNDVIATIQVGVGALGMTAAGGRLWVANDGDGTLSSIDPGSNEATTVPIHQQAPGEILPAIATDTNGRIWVSDAHALDSIDPNVSPAGLLRLDPTTSAVVERVSIAGLPPTDSFQALTLLGGSLWTIDGAGTLVEVAP